MPNGNIWQDRENAIVNGIMSGANACGTLRDLAAKAVGSETADPDPKPLDDFIRSRVRSVMTVIAQEDFTEDADNAAVRRDLELKRQALESVVANIPAIADNPGVMATLRAALPGHPFLG